MHDSARTADLDELAGELWHRLVAEAAAPQAGALLGRIEALVDRDAAMLDPESRVALVDRIAVRCVGFGPLEPLLRDPDVDEVMVSGTAPVWIERRGRLEHTTVAFADEAELRHVIERILSP